MLQYRARERTICVRLAINDAQNNDKYHEQVDKWNRDPEAKLYWTDRFSDTGRAVAPLSCRANNLSILDSGVAIRR